MCAALLTVIIEQEPSNLWLRAKIQNESYFQGSGTEIIQELSLVRDSNSLSSLEFKQH